MKHKKLTRSEHNRWVDKILYHYRTGLTSVDHTDLQVYCAEDDKERKYPSHYSWVGMVHKPHLDGIPYEIRIEIYGYGKGVSIHLYCNGHRNMCGARVNDGRTAKRLQGLADWSYRSMGNAMAVASRHRLL